MSQHYRKSTKIYLTGWIISCTAIVALSLILAERTLLEAINDLWEFVTWKRGLLFIHIVILILFLGVSLYEHFFRIYRDQGVKIMIRKLLLRLFFPLTFVSGIVSLVIHNNTQEAYQFSWDVSVENHTGKSKDFYALDGKHRGMTVFNWRNDVDESINQLVKNNIEWVSMVPYVYQKTERTKVIEPRDSIGYWTYWDSVYISVINKVHDRDMHVMLKPHLWMSEGWRSNIQMDTKEEWDTWFKSYRRHIIHFAMLADYLDVELYCIGTEFKSSIMAQSDKWKDLIREVKKIYSGKLTYAANWDGEHEEVKFWDDMDYIGIQAYYPLTDKNNPKLSDIKKGWRKHIKMLKKLSRKYDKPILFSEVGYRSDASATIEPWVWGSALDVLTNKKSNETQNLAYEALFQSLWDKDWFAGMYFWQWHNGTKKDEPSNMDFTPRFKPAENTMAKWYGMESQ